ncbi:MAG: alpha-ribazole phosphatase [Bacillota bacterium]
MNDENRETEVILIRHGETSWNREHRFQGHQDIKLNNKGVNQAKKAGQFLASYDIDVIYSSELERAYQTAVIINKKHRVKVIKKSGLKEINFGDWEGLTYEEIEKNNSEKIKKWNNNPWSNSPPAGESLESFYQKVVNTIDGIIEKNKGDTILIVSHGGVIKTYLTYILDMPPENYWQFDTASTGISNIKFYNNKAIIDRINSRPHLNL